MHSNRNTWLKIGRILRWIVAVALLLGVRAPISAQETESRLQTADRLAQSGKLLQARHQYELAIREGAALEHDAARARTLGFCYLDGVPADLPQAARWLGLAVTLNPADLATRVAWAHALDWSGKPVQAAEQYLVLAQAKPDSDEFAIAYATALDRAGKRDTATEALAQFVERRPADARARFELARLLAYSRRFPEAMGHYQVLLQADPANRAVKTAIAKVFAWQGDQAAALRAFDDVLRSDPDFYEARAGKGFTLLWMGKPAEAKPLLQWAAARNPGDREVNAALRQIETNSQPASSSIAAAAPPDSVFVAHASPLPPMTAGEADLFPPAARAAELIRQAEQAAGQSKFAQAAGFYRDALAVDPSHARARRSLAQVLSWAGDYAASLAIYDQLLAGDPADGELRVQRARVRSWSKDFSGAISDYRTALKSMKAGDEVRFEMARVLGWAREYEQADVELERVIAAAHGAQRVAALVEKGRVLSWARRYPQAVASYEAALNFEPYNVDARFGHAQCLYWSGQLPAASRELQALIRDLPGHREARYTLAAVEYASGRGARALTLLHGTPETPDTTIMRNAIRAELRPVLRVRFGYGDDRETTSAGDASALRVLRYSTAFEFSPRPDLRVELMHVFGVSDTSNSVLARYGRDALATETLVRMKFRPTPWLNLMLGAGDGTTPGVSGRQHFALYEAQAGISRGDVRLNFGIVRRLLDATPLAVHDGLVQTREFASWSYLWRRRLNFAGEYWHANYALRDAGSGVRVATFADGGSLSITPVLYRNERLTVEAGVRYDLIRFDQSAVALNDAVRGVSSAGFFTPRIYQRYAATTKLAWAMHRLVNLEVHGSYGPQRVFGFAEVAPPPARWERTGTAGAQLNARFGSWEPYLAVDYFSTHTTTAFGAGRTGTYNATAIAVGFAHRF